MRTKSIIYYKNSTKKLFFILFFYFKYYPSFDIMGLLFDLNQSNTCCNIQNLTPIQEIKKFLSIYNVINYMLTIIRSK
jgi:hypothetical protein